MVSVAVQISGAPRTVVECAKGIKEAWNSPEYQPHYFLTLWNDQLSKEDEDTVLSCFENCTFLFMHTKDFSTDVARCSHLPTDMDRPENVFHQAYGRKICNNLRINYEKKNNFKFDIVHIGRPDEIYDCPIRFQLSNIKPRHIYLPNHSQCSGLNDHGCIAGGLEATAYADHYTWLVSSLHNAHRERMMTPYKGPFLRRDIRCRPWITPEFLYEYYLRCKTNLYVIEYPIIYKTIRSKFVGVPFAQIPQMSANMRERDKWL